MKYHSAWVTLTGKVFVSEDELATALGLEYKQDAEGETVSPTEQLADVHPERIEVAFKDLANDKIRELISTDEPMKLDEVEIDMSSFR